MLGKFYIKTYGCQMNTYDSERMRDIMVDKGYEEASDYLDANVFVLNTCHIREKATEKVYSELGRIRKVLTKEGRNRKEVLLVVAGCVAQAEGEYMFTRGAVDVVVGPQSYDKLPELIQQARENHNRRAINLDFTENSKFDSLKSVAVQSKGNCTAFVSIQEGCDKFCTFCVVPYTRGAEFSRPVNDILREVEKLINSGVKEIYLLGQNVNAYNGMDDKGKRSNLGKLIFAIEKMQGVQRLRYTTSHPNDMHDDLYEAHATVGILAPFLHLPVQSGSNRILKMMNRRHSTEDYLEIIRKLRSCRPDIAFSSDFIVGFPSETAEDFEQTLELIKEVNYAQAYSFKYSPRHGTTAAEHVDQLTDSEKSIRLARLQALLIQQQVAFNENMIGKKLKVLFDRRNHKRDDKSIIGKTDYLQSLILKDETYLNQLVEVKVLEAQQNSLFGLVS